MRSSQPLQLLDSLRVASFCGAQARGNAHWLRIYRDKLPEQFALNPEHPSDICVDIALLTADPGLARIQFSVHQRAIKRCGSGSLAAAFALAELLQQPQCKQLQSPAENLYLIHDDNRPAYRAEGLPLRPCLPPPEAARLFPTPAQHWFAAGGEQDYLIADFAEQASLLAIQATTLAMSLNTQRALIATAPSATDEYDYALRYFAPQYGVQEDAATGSAHIVVAALWQQRLNQARVRGIQLSPGGGEFWVRQAECHVPQTLQQPHTQIVSGWAQRL